MESPERITYFAQKAFLCDDGKLLLVQKSSTDPHNPRKWEVPGGRMDFGESVDEHLRREVREEVGLTIEPSTPFYVWEWVLDRKSADGVTEARIQIIAVARMCIPVTFSLDYSGRVPEDHLGKAEWVPYNEVLRYDLIPNMLPVMREFLNRV